MSACQKILDENRKKTVEPRPTRLRSNAGHSSKRKPPAAEGRRLYVKESSEEEEEEAEEAGKI